MTCFMAPGWMGADGKWVCSDSRSLSEPCVGDKPISSEDSW